MADGGPEIRADAQWMTYEEAATRLGIGADSVARYARRERWPRQPGNDGKARVAIPPDFIPESAPEKRRADKRPDSAPDKALAELLRTEIERADVATERAAKAEGEAAALRKWAEAAEERLEAAARRLEEERARAEEAARRLEVERARGEAARIQAARLEGELGALRRPWWRRLTGQ